MDIYKKTMQVLILIIPLASHLASYSYTQGQAITAGPMIHLNFDTPNYCSIAFEAAYWRYGEYALYGADIGLEFSKKYKLLYIESQLSWFFGGISLGPVFALNSDTGPKTTGFQGSVWGCYFLGLDLRYRRLCSDNIFAPGLFFKYPVFLYGDWLP